MTSPWLRRILIANLTLQVLIVVTGGLVRLTGSGLGCPTWPLCEGDSLTPVIHDAMTFHPFVEYGNRMLSVLVGVGALVTVWAVRRWARDRTPMMGLAWSVLGLTVEPPGFFYPNYTSIHRVAAARSGERSILAINETSHLRHTGLPAGLFDTARAR